MDDLISRQAAIDAAKHAWAKGLEPSQYIELLEPVQPEHIKGHWIEITSRNHTYKCYVCGRLLVNITDGKNNVAKNYPYCHCGADMREEKMDGKKV
jgi:ribosomal protein S27E